MIPNLSILIGGLDNAGIELVDILVNDGHDTIVYGPCPDRFQLKLSELCDKHPGKIKHFDPGPLSEDFDDIVATAISHGYRCHVYHLADYDEVVFSRTFIQNTMSVLRFLETIRIRPGQIGGLLLLPFSTAANTVYSAAKRSNELLAESYLSSFGVDLRIVKSVPAFGPTVANRTLETVLKRIILGDPITVYNHPTALVPGRALAEKLYATMQDRTARVTIGGLVMIDQDLYTRLANGAGKPLITHLRVVEEGPVPTSSSVSETEFFNYLDAYLKHMAAAEKRA